eukprot:170630_1
MSALVEIESLLSLFHKNITCTQYDQQNTPETQSYSVEEKQQPQYKMIQRLDEQLRIYYDEHDSKDYWTDGDNNGKFAQWCDDNEYDDSHLEDEFTLDATDAIITQFDSNFPLPAPIPDEQQKIGKIFQILKYLYQGKDLMFVDQFELLVTEEQIVKTRDICQKHIKTWGTDGDFTQLTDINVLYFLTVSRINTGNNLLINLMDSYNRDIITKFIKLIEEHCQEQKEEQSFEYKIGNEVERIDEWISARPFLKELDQEIKKMSRKLNITKIQTMITNKKQSETKPKTKTIRELNLQTLLHTYPKRIGCRLRLTGRLIDDSLEMVSKCITSSATFVNQLINSETAGIGGTPFLIDFMILLQPSISNREIAKINRVDEDNDDEDDEYGQTVDHMVYDSDIIGDVAGYLKQHKCKLFEGELSDIANENKEIDIESYDQIARKCIKNAFTKLRGQIKGHDGKYPQNRRVNIIIDRRDYYKTKPDDKDKLIVFEPPNDCSELSHTDIPECFFDLSRQCLIPTAAYVPWKQRSDKGKKYSFDSIQSSQGQILTLSYHVTDANEVKCYLLWNGYVHRFYPQDIVELLPHIFRKDKDNKDFSVSNEAKRLIKKMNKCIKDPKFEMFYRGVNQWNKYRFPKRYTPKSEIL